MTLKRVEFKNGKCFSEQSGCYGMEEVSFFMPWDLFVSKIFRLSLSPALSAMSRTCACALRHTFFSYGQLLPQKNLLWEHRASKTGSKYVSMTLRLHVFNASFVNHH